MKSYDQKIEEVMTRVPYSVEPDEMLNEAWGKMRSRNYRQLPVVQSGRLVGVLSDRALRLALSFEGSSRLKVNDVMVTDALKVRPQDPLSSVCFSLANHAQEFALVMGPNESVVGIFTAQDAFRVLGDFASQAPAKVA